MPDIVGDEVVPLWTGDGHTDATILRAAGFPAIDVVIDAKGDHARGDAAHAARFLHFCYDRGARDQHLVRFLARYFRPPTPEVGAPIARMLKPLTLGINWDIRGRAADVRILRRVRHLVRTALGCAPGERDFFGWLTHEGRVFDAFSIEDMETAFPTPKCGGPPCVLEPSHERSCETGKLVPLCMDPASGEIVHAVLLRHPELVRLRNGRSVMWFDRSAYMRPAPPPTISLAGKALYEGDGRGIAEIAADIVRIVNAMVEHRAVHGCADRSTCRNCGHSCGRHDIGGPCFSRERIMDVTTLVGWRYCHCPGMTRRSVIAF